MDNQTTTIIQRETMTVQCFTDSSQTEYHARTLYSSICCIL